MCIMGWKEIDEMSKWGWLALGATWLALLVPWLWGMWSICSMVAGWVF
jgi:hypothetical protein